VLTKESGGRGRFAASAAAALLMAGGVTTIGLGLRPGIAPQRPPASSQALLPPHSAPDPATTAVKAPPPPAIASSTGSPGSGSSASAAAAPPAAPPATSEPTLTPPKLPASTPVRLDIPTIGVDTNLLRLSLNADGTVEVPPVQPGSPAGWYRYSPTPGEIGPAVILGHVNSINSPVGVFSRLHELGPGSQVTVTRADGIAAVFEVDRTTEVPKDQFPTQQVYGNTARAELRLITCGNYDPASRRWNTNTVIYAHLLSSHSA